MAILHLTLHRQWFDQIANGTKKIEYREAKPYWISRLEGQTFDEVHFRNGYHREAPFMRVKIDKITKRKGFYSIHLGPVLSVDK